MAYLKLRKLVSKLRSLINWELCTAIFVSGELLVRDFILFKSETLFAQNDWPFFLTMYVFFIPSISTLSNFFFLFQAAEFVDQLRTPETNSYWDFFYQSYTTVLFLHTPNPQPLNLPLIKYWEEIYFIRNLKFLGLYYYNRKMPPGSGWKLNTLWHVPIILKLTNRVSQNKKVLWKVCC